MLFQGAKRDRRKMHSVQPQACIHTQSPLLLFQYHLSCLLFVVAIEDSGAIEGESLGKGRIVSVLWKVMQTSKAVNVDEGKK